MGEMSSAFKDLAQGYRCGIDKHLKKFDKIINGQANCWEGTTEVDARPDLEKVAQVFRNIRDLADSLLEYVDYEKDKEQ